jgi:outer membrane protein assembly factor BamE
MSDSHRWMTRLGLLGMACAALSACGSLDDAGKRLTQIAQPYRMDLVQGNVVTREQAAVLRPGMSRLQVRDILGTPLLTSVFHAERWDYVFTLRRQGAEPQAHRLTVFFKGDVLERTEADDLPSEAEFVATLERGNAVAGKKVPVLEASPESLDKFPPPAQPATPDLPPLPASYPPLEPITR